MTPCSKVSNLPEKEYCLLMNSLEYPIIENYKYKLMNNIH